MTETILRLLLKAGEVFLDERRKQLSRELEEKYSRVQKEKNKRFPNFNNDRLALAEQDLNAFLLAFEKEFGERLEKIMNEAYSNG
jgi:hypothetical protein